MSLTPKQNIVIIKSDLTNQTRLLTKTVPDKQFILNYCLDNSPTETDSNAEKGSIK